MKFERISSEILVQHSEGGKEYEIWLILQPYKTGKELEKLTGFGKEAWEE